ncbi:hypothetical protein Tco_1468017 [Tanacetum coccineum]
MKRIRSEGDLSRANPGGPLGGKTLEGKWEKHKLNRRTRDVRELHRRSDLVEISDKFVRLVVVDVYGLENECACTK